MTTIEQLKSAVKASIKPNGRQEITGGVLQETLIKIIDAVYSAIPDVVNDLVSGGSAKSLSAEQGKLLNTAVAEALVSLAARLDAIESSKGLLGNATAGVLDVSEITRDRYPLVLCAHGVPAEANIPENLPKGLPWDGLPAFKGQQYIDLDAASGGLYYATGNESINDWKQA